MSTTPHSNYRPAVMVIVVEVVTLLLLFALQQAFTR
jgi:hypothetical protein